MTARSRNPERTRRAILDAATAEFCAVGPAGARIDAIAAAAGVNKRMLYHYFASKEGLFAAVLDDRLASEPFATTAASLIERFANAAHQPDRIRLLMWEALAGGAPSTGDDARAAAWRARVADLEAARRRGRQSDLDAAQLELSLAAIALFPFAFPQVTRLITGTLPTDPEFIAARTAFLTAFEARLERSVAAAPEPKPRYRRAASVTESGAVQPPREIDANTSK